MLDKVCQTLSSPEGISRMLLRLHKHRMPVDRRVVRGERSPNFFSSIPLDHQRISYKQIVHIRWEACSKAGRPNGSTIWDSTSKLE